MTQTRIYSRNGCSIGGGGGGKIEALSVKDFDGISTDDLIQFHDKMHFLPTGRLLFALVSLEVFVKIGLSMT